MNEAEKIARVKEVRELILESMRKGEKKAKREHLHREYGKLTKVK